MGTSNRMAVLRLGMVLAALVGMIVLGSCGTDDIDSLAKQYGGGPSGPPYNIGNDVQFGLGTSPRSADSLQGYGQLVVSKPTYLLSLSIIIFDLVSGPANMKLALYADSGGLPGPRIVATAPRALVLGVNKFPVSPRPLAPGTYWIVSNADQVFSEYYAGGVTTDLAFWLLTYSSPFPDPFPVVTPSTTNPVNRYMTVAD